MRGAGWWRRLSLRFLSVRGHPSQQIVAPLEVQSPHMRVWMAAIVAETPLVLLSEVLLGNDPPLLFETHVTKLNGPAPVNIM